MIEKDLTQELRDLSRQKQENIRQQEIQAGQQKQAEQDAEQLKKLAEARQLIAALPQKLRQIASSTEHRGTRVMLFEPGVSFDPTEGSSDPEKTKHFATHKLTTNELGELNSPKWSCFTIIRRNPACLRDNSPAKIVFDGCRNLGLNTAIITEIFECGHREDSMYNSEDVSSIVVSWDK